MASLSQGEVAELLDHKDPGVRVLAEEELSARKDELSGDTEKDAQDRNSVLLIVSKFQHSDSPSKIRRTIRRFLAIFPQFMEDTVPFLEANSQVEKFLTQFPKGLVAFGNILGPLDEEEVDVQGESDDIPTLGKLLSAELNIFLPSLKGAELLGLRSATMKTLGALERLDEIISQFTASGVPTGVVKQGGDLLELPKEKGKRSAVFQIHFRGRSVHGDLRISLDEDLIGWTLAFQRPGAVPSALSGKEALSQAVRLAETFDPSGSRLNKDIRAPKRVTANPKERHSDAFLNIDKKAFEPGSVGASANEWGYLVAVDRPKVEFGLQKPDSHEYFLTEGKHLKGTLSFRKLEGREGGEPVWTGFLQKNILPSVLRTSSVRSQSMPPNGRSAIPEALERITPAEFRYWEKQGAEARAMRDALVASRFFTEENVRIVNGQFSRIGVRKFLLDDNEHEGTYEKIALVDFALSWQFFKGQEGVNEGPTRQVLRLILDKPEGGLSTWEMDSDPLSDTPTLTALAKDRSSKDLLHFDGALEPGQIIGGEVLNESEDTPGRVRIQDKGKAILLEDGEVFKRIDFRGEKLNGIFVLVADEEKPNVWKFEKEGLDASALGAQGQSGELAPIAIFAPLKSRAGRDGMNSFFETKKLVSGFAKPIFTEGNGLSAEPKWGGLRIILQKKGSDISIAFGDSLKVNRQESFPSLSQEMRNIPTDFILDGSLIDHDDRGYVLPRLSLARFSGESPEDDSHIKIKVFDVLFWKKSLTGDPLSLRRKVLEEEVFSAKFDRLELSDSILVQDEDSLQKAIQKVSQIPGSEGAMVKLLDSQYSLAGESALWASLELDRRLFAVVTGKTAVERAEGVFTYDAAIGPLSPEEVADYRKVVEIEGKPYTPIGRTFHTKEKLDKGNIIEVAFTELLVEKSSGKFDVRWFTPRVIGSRQDLTNPTSLGDVLGMARTGEIKRQSLYDKTLTRTIPVFKTKEERFVLGIVLIPEKADSQREIYSAEEIRKTAHGFMEFYLNVGRMHSEIVNGKIKVLESYLAPQDLVIGGRKVIEGTWLMAFRVVDSELWEQVKSGELTGLSIGGSALRIPERAAA